MIGPLDSPTSLLPNFLVVGKGEEEEKEKEEKKTGSFQRISLDEGEAGLLCPLFFSLKFQQRVRYEGEVLKKNV